MPLHRLPQTLLPIHQGDEVLTGPPAGVDYRFPLERGRPRTLQARLLGGLLIWVTSLCCGPPGNWRGKPLEKIPGLHIELVAMQLHRLGRRGR